MDCRRIGKHTFFRENDRSPVKGGIFKCRLKYLSQEVFTCIYHEKDQVFMGLSLYWPLETEVPNQGSMEQQSEEKNGIGWYWDYCCSLRFSFTHDSPFGPASPIHPHQDFEWDSSPGTLFSIHTMTNGPHSPLSSHAGLPWLCSYSLRPYPHLELSQLTLQLGVFPFMLWDQSHISIRRGCPGHIITTDTALHSQLSALSLQLPMTYICVSLTWQTSHFPWLLIYKIKLEYSPSSLSCASRLWRPDL